MLLFRHGNADFPIIGQLCVQIMDTGCPNVAFIPRTTVFLENVRGHEWRVPCLPNPMDTEAKCREYPAHRHPHCRQLPLVPFGGIPLALSSGTGLFCGRFGGGLRFRHGATGDRNGGVRFGCGVNGVWVGGSRNGYGFHVTGGAVRRFFHREGALRSRLRPGVRIPQPHF